LTIGAPNMSCFRRERLAFFTCPCARQKHNKMRICRMTIIPF